MTWWKFCNQNNSKTYQVNEVCGSGSGSQPIIAAKWVLGLVSINHVDPGSRCSSGHGICENAVLVNIK